MYPYHNKIRQRIAAEKLVDFYFTHGYPKIGDALLLVFNTLPFKRPIRPHRWPEYLSLLDKQTEGGVH